MGLGMVREKVVWGYWFGNGKREGGAGGMGLGMVRGKVVWGMGLGMVRGKVVPGVWVWE